MLLKYKGTPNGSVLIQSVNYIIENNIIDVPDHVAEILLRNKSFTLLEEKKSKNRTAKKVMPPKDIASTQNLINKVKG